MTTNPRVVSASVESGFRVRLSFLDGTTGVVDLAEVFRHRGGLLAPLQNPTYFATLSVDGEAGTIAWPNGVDLDPEMLYEAAHGRGFSAPQF